MWLTSSTVEGKCTLHVTEQRAVSSLRKEIADGREHLPGQPLTLHGCLTDRPHIDKGEAVTDNGRQLCGHLPGAPGDAPSVRNGALLNQDRDVVPISDLVRVAPSLFRYRSDAL